MTHNYTVEEKVEKFFELMNLPKEEDLDLTHLFTATANDLEAVDLLRVWFRYGGNSVKVLQDIETEIAFTPLYEAMKE